MRGTRIIYRHFRISDATGLMFRYSRGRNMETPAARGGMTHCAILEPGKATKVGMSLCSLKDHFCYSEGRNVARDRAEEGEDFPWPEWAENYIPAPLRKAGTTEIWIKKWAERWEE